MTNDYLRKEDATKVICEWGTRQERIGRYAVTIHELKQNTADMLDELPPTDVAPVVHGKWIEEWWHGEKTRKCSVCNLTQTVNVYKGEVKFNYCPYCGAKMDGGELDG